ncbi:MAG: GGDEF domain-containing protein, partial [Helicobacteraceae bacterium]|nr:GGDEF domain-containing protein [Helicobacteraceae bacterium]
MNDRERALQSEIEHLKTELATKEATIYRIMHEDQFVGLGNRRKLSEKLRTKGEKALVFVDICRVVAINAVYGPHAGDHVIKQVAVLLRQCKPTNAELFRFSGDNFAFLIDAPAERQGEHLAELIFSFAAHNTVIFEDVEIKPSFVIGIAYGTDTQLIRMAMAALQDAKNNGCGRY